MAESMILAEALLGQIASELEAMPAEKIRLLREGKATIRLVVRNSARRKAVAEPSIEADEALESLVARLRLLESREEGVELLKAISPRKSDLVRLSKRLDLPVTKVDNIARIRAGIVEFTIGYRLNSHAIRNHPLR